MHASWKISDAYLASEAPSCTGDSDHRDCDIALWRQNLSLPWNNAVKGLTSSLLLPPMPWSEHQQIPCNSKFWSSRQLFQVSQKWRSQSASVWPLQVACKSPYIMTCNCPNTITFLQGAQKRAVSEKGCGRQQWIQAFRSIQEHIPRFLGMLFCQYRPLGDVIALSMHRPHHA